MCVQSYVLFFFFQAEDGIRDLVRSRGLGDVYKRQDQRNEGQQKYQDCERKREWNLQDHQANADANRVNQGDARSCLLYTSDAADERSSVDLGGRRIIKKKKTKERRGSRGRSGRHILGSLSIASHSH